MADGVSAATGSYSIAAAAVSWFDLEYDCPPGYSRFRDCFDEDTMFWEGCSDTDVVLGDMGICGGKAHGPGNQPDYRRDMCTQYFCPKLFRGCGVHGAPESCCNCYKRNDDVATCLLTPGIGRPHILKSSVARKRDSAAMLELPQQRLFEVLPESTSMSLGSQTDVWLVKSQTLNIQARLKNIRALSSTSSFGKNSSIEGTAPIAVSALALGGRVLGGTLVITGHSAEIATWNGLNISGFASPDFVLPGAFQITRRLVHNDSVWSPSLSALSMTKSKNHKTNSGYHGGKRGVGEGVDKKISLELKDGVRLSLTQMHHHLSVALTLPRKMRPEGLCRCRDEMGSPKDQRLALIATESIVPVVSLSDSLFPDSDHA
eukprot:TRINITY_DN77790_c0_g1_i1.p1 TRINITY_DN77790_c0_g1~~TRINITY_DN77790_c0_g1_i1.p1  ORF type:complete len:411 (-),score=65.71 TRINITY_DN77790_c0_g1_i1:17-1138(-)